jgi:hypothetical protein
MNGCSWFGTTSREPCTGDCPPENEYNYLHPARVEPAQTYEAMKLGPPGEHSFCPCCGARIVHGTSNGLSWLHNVGTCRLVNLALSDLGITLDRSLRVNIYRGMGPMKGYYSVTDPYTIHISEEAYSRYPEYIIFHETKHLVDCLTKGWSDEDTPDPFARSLCAKHGYEAPPLNPRIDLMQFSYAPLPQWM